MKGIEVIVIGCGASGMMAAVAAARNGANVRIIEKNDRAGKKLLATGNGRCNFTNMTVQASDFNNSDKGFTDAAFGCFGVEKTIDFFEQLGIFPRIEAEGRVYPYSEQAASVLGAFLTELKRLRVEIVFSSPVSGVKKIGDAFVVLIDGGRQYKADKVIVACGGKAGSQYGCTGDGYAVAVSFSHRLAPPRPALVQIECEAPFFRQLKGVRAKGRVSLVDSLHGSFTDSLDEAGEIQFTETGLSGICIFNLSRYIAKIAQSGQQGEKEKAVVRLDLIPEMTKEQLTEKLKERLLHSGHKTLEEFLNGIVNHKLIEVILKESRAWEGYKSSAALDAAAIDRIVRTLKGWDIKVTGTKGWKDAQVTAGGVLTEDVDTTAMESKLVKGLYFAGEILDVDGRCGGYNLQWAWSSGYVAGEAAGGGSGSRHAEDQ